MSESKHTPAWWGTHTLGPWMRATPEPNNHHIIDKQRFIIADIMTDSISPEFDANACLIAASPEILEALESARAHLCMSITNPSTNPLIAKIDAAITKAKGE